MWLYIRPDLSSNFTALPLLWLLPCLILLLAVKCVTHRISGPMMPSWLAKVFDSRFIFNLLFSCLLSLLTRGPPGWLVKANLWGLSYQWSWTSYPIKELDSLCISNEPLIHDHWQSKEIFWFKGKRFMYLMILNDWPITYWKVVWSYVLCALIL